MAATWDKSLFDLAYSLNVEPDGHPNTREAITLHYNRAALYPEMLRRAEFIKQQFNLGSADRVLIVGCGFGWTAEALASLGVECIGTDVSAYVQANKAASEDADIAAAVAAVGLSATSGEGLAHYNRLRGDGVRTRATILNEDSSTTTSRNRVKAAFSAGITLIITEDLVTSLTDAECASLQTLIGKYNVSRVCHFVTELANPNPPFNFNSKTIADWKAMFPTSTIIADGYRYKVA